MPYSSFTAGPSRAAGASGAGRAEVTVTHLQCGLLTGEQSHSEACVQYDGSLVFNEIKVQWPVCLTIPFFAQ